ncbi:SGNH/GDSL hydrolase family protein [Allokutzneria sp. NRRL B-24872]|uniref:SGNH/GDSL hydrolase family protein n=1 Tax=Allokutzneria sp. NRRL B-24872 TaxID=1137961 RepID=UPI000A360383|nr:SGNH/GDSL hydrolase family protein [Allokutzneria sp. NRRL B-24872]
MRSTRTTALALAALLPVLLAATPAQGAHYVALGDSFSSGQGTARYYRDSGDCARGPLAYSALWAAANAVASYTSVACSGATTSDVLKGQIRALSEKTTLVTISIGGNDIGAPAAMRECTLGSKAGCDRILANAVKTIATTLAGELDSTYAAIRKAAPNAKVVVVGYPRIFEPGAGSCDVLTRSRRAEVVSITDSLAGVISARAAAAGFAFLDARAAFAGHELCSRSPWINEPGLPADDSYHPNRAGNAKGYLPALTALLT